MTPLKKGIWDIIEVEVYLGCQWALAWMIPPVLVEESWGWGH